MHLMKHLFGQFVKDSHNFDENQSLISMENPLNEFAQKELKIPAVQLFSELGKLFDSELKNTLTG